jgi:hypothetical protein
MAMPSSRPPAVDRSLVRNRVPVKPWTEVPNVPYEPGRSHELPGCSAVWCEPTKAWWDSIRTMPHVVAWSESDWQFAYTTALLHQAVWTGDDPGKVGELRMRERLMGCTAESRVTLRIRYIDPGDEPTQGTRLAPVSQIGFPARERPRPTDLGGAQ